MAKKHDPKTGRFVRTTPDYKALYEAEHAKYLSEQNFSNELKRTIDNLKSMRAYSDLKIEFLLDHCGPICKWLYRKHFVKEGGN